MPAPTPKPAAPARQPAPGWRAAARARILANKRLVVVIGAIVLGLVAAVLTTGSKRRDHTPAPETAPAEQPATAPAPVVIVPSAVVEPPVVEPPPEPDPPERTNPTPQKTPTPPKGTAPARAGTVVFSAADARPGRAELRHPQRTTQVAPDMFPAPWYVNAWKAGIAGEVEVAEVDGAPAVVLRCLPEATVAGIELACTGPGLRVTPTTRYVLRLTYKTDGPVKAWFEARSAPSARTRLSRVDLGTTNGWEVAELEFTSGTDYPLFLVVSNDDLTGESRVYVRSIEVTTP
jgi:hypothetical protein